MLMKGTVDMLLVKPIHRWVLLTYKYVGGLTFVFLNTAYAIVGIWLVVGLKSGVWPTGSLLLILTLTFFSRFSTRFRLCLRVHAAPLPRSW